METIAVPHANPIPTPCHVYNILAFMAKKLTTVGFIRGLCAYTGTCPTELPPLDECIDTDLFNDILGPDGFFNHSLTGIQFSYAGFEVWLTNEGEVSLFE